MEHITAYKDTASTLCALETHRTAHIIGYKNQNTHLVFFFIALEQAEDLVRLFTV